MQTAIVIPFPTRAAPEPDGQARLDAALQGLHAALGEQQAAIREWRFAMAELSIGVAGLGHSLTVYQENLGTVTTKLTGLREEAANLERWADTALNG